MTTRRLTDAAVCACIMLLGACGGGGTNGGTAPAIPASTSSSHATAPVHLSFVVPKKTASSKARSAQYVSTSTQSLTITVTPAGGSAQSPISVACTSTCVASFQAPVGTDSIALALTDGSNGTGNQLSLCTTTVTIVPNTANTFHLTANPVVGSVAILLGTTPAATASTNGGSAADVPMTVDAMDADGNTIVGSADYIDANGNPLVITVGATNAQDGGNGTIALSQTTFSAPSSTPALVHYDGGWLDHGTIGVTAPASLVAHSTAGVLYATPAATEYAMGISPGSQPYGITSGPDGALWFAEYGLAQIGRMTITGTTHEYGGLAAASKPVGITTGSDGNLWFTESQGMTCGAYGAMTPSGGLIGEYADGYGAWDIISGPGGKLWGSEGGCGGGSDSIDNTTTGGVFNYTETFLDYTNGNGIAVGPDNNIWAPAMNSNVVTQLNPTTYAYTNYTAPAGAGPRYITAGPDGNLWVTDTGDDCIAKLTTAGAFTEYCSGISSGAALSQIIAGPDGALWFTETGTDKIGRITTGGTVSEYATGITPGSGPFGLTVGPDGNIWFTESAGNRIAKLVF